MKHFSYLAASALLASTSALYSLPALAGFNAISYSQDTGASGSSWNYQTRSEAEQRAQQECSKHGRGCKAVLWFRNACGALATSTGNAYGASWAESEKLAKYKAINRCHKYSENALY